VRIALVGFMGAGKTSVGRRLAKALRTPFVDLDELVEEFEGRTIPSLFTESEEVFRQAERRALATLMTQDCVLATGGGTPLRSMDTLLEWGIVVFLDAPLSVLSERVGSGIDRPVWSEAAERYALRQPIYSRAHHRIDATQTVAAQVRMIRELVCA